MKKRQTTKLIPKNEDSIELVPEKEDPTATSS